MLLNAIYFMDSKSVTHRDIKPDNTLVDRNYEIKVGDLGHATMSKNGGEYIILK